MDKRANNRGISLIELILGVFIVSILAVGVATLAPHVAKTLSDSSRKTDAKNLAADFIAWARANRTALRVTDMNNLTWPNCELPWTQDHIYYPPYTESRNGTVYTRGVCIEQGDQIVNSTWYAAQGPDANPGGLLRVNVGVSWLNPDGSQGYYQTATMIDRPFVGRQTLTSHMTLSVCGAKAPPEDTTCDPAKVSSIIGTLLAIHAPRPTAVNAPFAVYGGPITSANCATSGLCTVELDVPRGDYVLRFLQNGYFPYVNYPLIVTPGSLLLPTVYLRKISEYSSKVTAEVFTSRNLLIAEIGTYQSGREYIMVGNPTQLTIPYPQIIVLINGNPITMPATGNLTPGGFLLLGTDPHSTPRPDVVFPSGQISNSNGSIQVKAYGTLNDEVGWGGGSYLGSPLSGLVGSSLIAVRQLRRGETSLPPIGSPAWSVWSPSANSNNNGDDFLVVPPGSAPIFNSSTHLFGRTGLPAPPNATWVQVDDPTSTAVQAVSINAGKSSLVEIPSVLGAGSWDSTTIASQARFDLLYPAPFSYTRFGNWTVTAVSDDLQYGRGALDTQMEFRVAPSSFSGVSNAQWWSLMSPPVLNTGATLFSPLPCVLPGPCDTTAASGSADFVLHTDAVGTLPDAKAPYIVLDSPGCYSTVTGVVQDGGGHPLGGISVQIGNTDLGSMVEKLTQPDGHFTMIMPSSGSINIAVNDYSSAFMRPDYVISDLRWEPSDTQVLPCGHGPFTDPSRTINLTPIHAYTLTANPIEAVVMAGSGTVQGTVTAVEGGVPLSGTVVQVLQNNQLLAETTTDTAGHYLFAGLPFSELLQVRLETGGHGNTVIPSSGTHNATLINTVPKTFDFTAAGVPATIQGTAKAGTLVIASTQTWSGLPETWKPGTNSSVYMDVAEADGKFSLNPAPGMSYRIYCVPRGYISGTVPNVGPTTLLNAQEPVRYLNCP